jgi:VWFA-related protein
MDASRSRPRRLVFCRPLANANPGSRCRFLVALLSGPAILLAQQTLQPVFRTSAHLIVQTVSVKDKRGGPVEGLTAKDFVVTENGQPQEIAFIEYQRLDAAPLAPIADLTTSDAPVPATTVAPTTQVGVTVPVPGAARFRGRRLLVLYIDLYNMPFFDQLRVFSNADKYISARMTSADLMAVMVFASGRVSLKQDFTDDRVALRRVVADLTTAADDANNGGGISVDAGGAFGEDDDTFNLFSTDRQLAALQRAATDLGPLPEIKTLIYLGSGLRLNGADNMAQLRATVNAAVRSNVTINPIDTRGLIATPPLGDATRASPGGIGMFSGAITQAGTTRQQQSQDTYYALAKDTGGRAMFDTNDLSLGIAQAAQAVTGYYMIGYYTTNTVTDGRYRRVRVELANHPSVDLSYRPGYYGAKDYAKFSAIDKEQQLDDALRLEDPITDIPMAMEINYFQVSGAEYFVPVSVRMPGSELTRPHAGASTHAEIDMIGEIKDEYGVTIRNAKDRLEFTLDPARASAVARRPIQYEMGFSLLPGNYVIKVLARDTTTGRIGTYQKPFTVPNLEREAVRLPISTVVLACQRVARADALFSVHQKISSDVANPLVFEGQKLIPSVTRTFNASRPLVVFVQAYERDSTTMRPLVAFVTFFRDGAKVFETDLLSLDSWDPKSRAVPIRFSIALDGLQPGAYVCQVTVLDATGGKAAFWRAPIVLVR